MKALPYPQSIVASQSVRCVAMGRRHDREPLSCVGQPIRAVLQDTEHLSQRLEGWFALELRNQVFLAVIATMFVLEIGDWSQIRATTWGPLNEPAAREGACD